jgi:hypothetical protein
MLQNAVVKSAEPAAESMVMFVYSKGILAEISTRVGAVEWDGNRHEGPAVGGS